jgi:hypothetical protein
VRDRARVGITMEYVMSRPMRGASAVHQALVESGRKKSPATERPQLGELVSVNLGPQRLIKIKRPPRGRQSVPMGTL